ncbi:MULTISPECIES: cysteine hydrolase family protein [unclassified Granulicatella]|uniref:cysteine hydrolase family protein n=1 Tax=unclassified Granulicatella TaxID=2630493 RepID=UPI001074532A|nr:MULTISPECIES: isochorismatase family cysteine hydrolase [unclassified Granulicatella]MBF0779885.1 cysteine hydrolase [Granulicatella sp. 19428wC4_WM01]TFU96089.1 cysteine hydrolase [Granulicatella sp. WM01]
MKALIVIDYTNDFIATNGALTCGTVGQNIEHAIASLVKEFQANQDFIVFATDKHEKQDKYHPENKLFPPHNIVGTTGRHFYGELDVLAQDVNIYKMDKRRYSSFAGTDLDSRLRERSITEIHLCGVCTDICVLHTAIEGYNLGYDIVVHKLAVASFDDVGHHYALKHLEHVIGAKVI